MSSSSSSPVGSGYSAYLASLSLLFVGPDLSVVFGGNIGSGDKKFCGLEASTCGCVSHKTNKFDLRSGLYIRVTSTKETDKLQVYGSPSVDLEHHSVNVLMALMDMRGETPADWIDEFAVLMKSGPSDKLDVADLQFCKMEAECFKQAHTPGLKKQGLIPKETDLIHLIAEEIFKPHMNHFATLESEVLTLAKKLVGPAIASGLSSSLRSVAALAGVASGMGPDPSTSNSSTLQAEMDSVKQGMTAMHKVMVGLNSMGDSSMVNIGGFSFNEDSDVLVWMEKYLPAFFPFWCFL